MFPDLTNDTLSTILDLYPSSDFPPKEESGLPSGFYRSAQIFRDALLVCPSFLFGYTMARKYEADEVPSVYYYDQNQIPPGYLGQPAAMGVFHGADAPYVFGNFSAFDALGKVQPRPEDYELQRRQSRSWSGFGNVGRPSLENHDTLE
ncbi:hypothetical protein AAF712_009267 [Marasmius tenuissimus]|uniref:Carboxylesterase type B domain-containing protein n=1 Tax=Marasmius tenuissimus TaxID=585030 RepID=A0ABR2ZU29_9AGAR